MRKIFGGVALVVTTACKSKIVLRNLVLLVAMVAALGTPSFAILIWHSGSCAQVRVDGTAVCTTHGICQPGNTYTYVFATVSVGVVCLGSPVINYATSGPDLGNTGVVADGYAVASANGKTVGIAHSSQQCSGFSNQYSEAFHYNCPASIPPPPPPPPGGGGGGGRGCNYCSYNWQWDAWCSGPNDQRCPPFTE